MLDDLRKVVKITSLGPYKAYSQRLREDAVAAANFAFAKQERSTLKDERTFPCRYPPATCKCR
jgi:hypothetical protein